MTIKTKKQGLIYTVIVTFDNINFISLSTDKTIAFKGAMCQALSYIGDKNGH